MQDPDFSDCEKGGDSIFHTSEEVWTELGIHMLYTRQSGASFAHLGGGLLAG